MPGKEDLDIDLESAISRSHELLIERRHAENLEYLNSVIDRFPDDPELRLQYATCLAERPAEAAREVQRAIELDPDEPIRLTRAANLLFNIGEPDAARPYATRAAALVRPDFPLIAELVSVSALLAVHDGNDAAEEGLRLAVELAPGEERFVRDVAEFLTERGRVKEAMEIVEKALPLAVDSQEAERLRHLRDELDK